MTSQEIPGHALEASDVSGQKTVCVSGLAADASIGELVQGLLAEMQLPQNDVAGNPVTYHARLEREGRHLHASERAGDVVQPGDRVVLPPNINAGRLRSR